MKKSIVVALSVLLLAVLTSGAAETEKTHLRARLRPFNEVPVNVTDATGTFTAVVTDDSTVTYTLTYTNLSTPVIQAHIHIGASKTNGGVMVFLCGPNPTPVRQACPNDATNSGTVTGTFTAADILAPPLKTPTQGVTAGDLQKVLKAIADGNAYVNVHSTALPGGEIRGQVRSREHDEDDE